MLLARKHPSVIPSWMKGFGKPMKQNRIQESYWEFLQDSPFLWPAWDSSAWPCSRRNNALKRLVSEKY